MSPAHNCTAQSGNDVSVPHYAGHRFRCQELLAIYKTPGSPTTPFFGIMNLELAARAYYHTNRNRGWDRWRWLLWLILVPIFFIVVFAFCCMKRRRKNHVVSNQPYYKENYAPNNYQQGNYGGGVPPPPPSQPQGGYGGGYQQGYQAGYGGGGMEHGNNQNAGSGFNNDYNQNYGNGFSNDYASGSNAPPDYAPPPEPPKGYTK